MFTIRAQSSEPMVCKKFDAAGRMRPFVYYDHVVDLIEELFKFVLLIRGRTEYLADHYCERNERARKAIDAKSRCCSG